MRPTYRARLDETRPVLILTRELVRPHLNTVTVAPITTIIRGLFTEGGLGTLDGLENRCVGACDHVTTIPAAALGEQIGRLLDHQEPQLSEAIRVAFDLA